MIRACGNRVRALKPPGQAGWIAFESAPLADLVVRHALSAALRQRSGERHRAALSQNEALRTLRRGMLKSQCGKCPCTPPASAYRVSAGRR